ncbi:MAG: TraB/GumN family protein [Defluviitaleaceae bacterium]|nr:TraB/GumN family protein [Defluviitaleaceae bacterium]
MKRMKLAMVALVLAFVMAMPAVVMARPMDEVQLRIENGTIFVPLRLTAYAHGAEVEWDHENRLVVITSAYGDVWTVDVEAVGGFIEDGISWVPYEYALGAFDTAVVEEATDVEEATEQVDRPQIHGKLTRIEYGDNVAYIFGSMHAGRPEWFPLHPMVEEAMARADVFGFEVDMNEMMDIDEETLEAVGAMQFLPDGLTLEDVLPEDVFENFITNFESFSAIGLEYEMIANLTPIALTIAIETIMLASLGMELGIGDHMVDGYIAAFAQYHDRPIIGFEEILGQAGLLFDVPLEIQAYALVGFADFDTWMAALGGSDDGDDGGLIVAYENNDIDAFRAAWDAMEAASDANPFTQRNHYIMWNYRCHIYANGIAELLRETEEPTTFFFTFGLSHILGGGGGMVLTLLEDMGFEVVPLWD